MRDGGASDERIKEDRSVPFSSFLVELMLPKEVWGSKL